MLNELTLQLMLGISYIVINYLFLMQTSSKLATLGGGCFWCLDGVFRRVIGVTKVESGYSGDEQSKAQYSLVCSGKTRFAEVV